MISSTAIAQTQAELTTQEILRRTEQTTHNGFEHAPEFDYCVTSTNNDQTKTFAAYMLYGSPFEQLVAVNGIPLPKDQLDKIASARDAEEIRRSKETTELREKRTARYLSEQRRNRTLLNEMTRAFDFSLRGKALKDGWETYVLDVSPRAGYEPNDRLTRVLTGMRGSIWIDEKSFGWVRAEATLVHPVMIEGFLARVERGTRFAMEERPFGNGYWLPTFFSINTRARILFIFPSNSTQSYIFFHYVPAGTLLPEMCLSKAASPVGPQPFFAHK
jgi:hypothetical protein